MRLARQIIPPAISFTARNVVALAMMDPNSWRSLNRLPKGRIRTYHVATLFKCIDEALVARRSQTPLLWHACNLTEALDRALGVTFHKPTRTPFGVFTASDLAGVIDVSFTLKPKLNTSLPPMDGDCATEAVVFAVLQVGSERKIYRVENGMFTKVTFECDASRYFIGNHNLMISEAYFLSALQTSMIIADRRSINGHPTTWDVVPNWSVANHAYVMGGRRSEIGHWRYNLDCHRSFKSSREIRETDTPHLDTMLWQRSPVFTDGRSTTCH